MLPVIRGLIRYESLLDGSLDLADIAACNDALRVYDENSYRANEAMRPR